MKRETYMLVDHPFSELCLTYMEHYKYFTKYCVYYNLVDKAGNIKSYKSIQKITNKERMKMIYSSYDAERINYYCRVVKDSLHHAIKEMEEKDLLLAHGGVFSVQDVKNRLGYNVELREYTTGKIISKKYCPFDNNEYQEHLKCLINRNKSKQ